MRIDDSIQAPWAAAVAPREPDPRDNPAPQDGAAAASIWTGDQAFSAPRAAARLAGDATAAVLAAGADPAPVGGRDWLDQRGAALFEEGRPVLGTRDGLPIVGETGQERAQGLAYLREQLARRGQDTENMELVTVCSPVFDGATGPQVGWFQGTAARLDATGLKAVGTADLPENIAAVLRALSRR